MTICKRTQAETECAAGAHPAAEQLEAVSEEVVRQRAGLRVPAASSDALQNGRTEVAVLIVCWYTAHCTWFLVFMSPQRCCG